MMCGYAFFFFSVVLSLSAARMIFSMSRIFYHHVGIVFVFTAVAVLCVVSLLVCPKPMLKFYCYYGDLTNCARAMCERVRVEVRQTPPHTDSKRYDMI